LAVIIDETLVCGGAGTGKTQKIGKYQFLKFTQPPPDALNGNDIEW
jgi:hypothetical protein